VLGPSSQLIFPGSRLNQSLSDVTFAQLLRDMGILESATPHGFRSSFRNWCAEVPRFVTK
jgi:hypothetical protein